MARLLTGRHHLTVITNGIEVARLLSTDASNTVILLAGIMRPNGNTLGGTISKQILQDYHIKTAFVSCTGFSPERGFVEQDLHEADLKRLMLQSAQNRVVLLDSTKIGRQDFAVFGTLHDVNYLVTDHRASQKIIDEVRQAGTHIVVCGEKTVASYSPYDKDQHYYRIGFANLTEQTPFSRDVRRSLEAAARRSQRIELIVADNQLNADVALQVADELLDEDLDLVIEYQIDEATGSLISYKFEQVDIPVIAVDIPMVGATYFGVDNYKAGHIAGIELGKAVQKNWGSRYDYLIVLEQRRAGPLPAMRIQGQIEGFQEILGRITEKRIIRVDTDNTPEGARAEMEKTFDELEQDNRLAIACFNDDAAIGVIKAAQAMHRETNILLIGQGADRSLRRVLRQNPPFLVGATAFHPEAYGERLIDLAFRILAGEQVAPANYMHHTFIHAANVDEHFPLPDDNE
jgi:ribose transport system substrate-binding protein